MLKVILIVAAALAALVLVVAAIGWLLPRDHVAARSATFRAEPAAIFAQIASLEIGARDDVPIAIVEQRPPDRLVTRIADPGLPFGGTWTFELTPEGGGTRLTITERGYVSNPIFRVISRFVLGHEATMASYLRELAARLGEAAA
jgi:uncharacterized protein YndB with AHSA1/START domain